MKDILEGIVSDYLASKDYFCRLNVPYKKKVAGEEKENAYDIDVLAIKKNGVIVGDVKNWIGGIPANYFKTEFTPKTDTDQKKRYPRFKAISDHEVRDAMEQKVKELTGKKLFSI